jgi:dipeptidyl aminopeptidase/acylaminoacyl peptidase
MKRLLAILSCVALFGQFHSAPAGVNASQGPSMRAVLSASYAVRSLSDVSLTSDGRYVAWEESGRDPRHPLTSDLESQLFVQRTRGDTPVPLTAGASDANDEESPVWSPNGREIAFLSDARSSKQLQLFVADARDLKARQIGRLDGDVAHPAWSPDGRSIALLYIPNAHRMAGALAPGARDVGVIGEIVDEQRLVVVDVASGALHYVTPPDTYVYEYDWSPEGRQFAITYAKGNGDNNWWIARLARVDVGSGELHDLFAPSFQLNDPRWSPDGLQIAVIGGVMSDFGSTGGDLYLVDSSSGIARDATPNAAFSVQSLRWCDATTLDLDVHVPGAMRLLRWSLAENAPQSLTNRDEALWSWSSSRDGSTLAAVRTSFDDPPELWVGAPGALRQITHANAHAIRLYGKAVSLRWKSDGYEEQGWLVYPLGFDPSRRYPMITTIHGGPSAQTVPGFANRNISALTARGYFVFMPNPRGSFGQGEAFTRANIRDFGYGDWHDDLNGIDAAIAAAPIDSARLGLMGWSYGGYMAMWAETQTNRFKAIVAGAGIVNWQSYYGQNKIDQWMIPFFGASVYDNPGVYARSSPITFITHSQTPVLILQGERDEEVPAPQAFEFWHAMRTLGVPTKLIVYADEGHGPRKIVNQIDILQQTVSWFDRYL